MKQQQIAVVAFIVIMLPVNIYLSVWFAKVRKDTKDANFEKTMAI